MWTMSAELAILLARAMLWLENVNVFPRADPLYERQELVLKRQIQNTARWPPGTAVKLTERVLPAQQPGAQSKTAAGRSNS